MTDQVCLWRYEERWMKYSHKKVPLRSPDYREAFFEVKNYLAERYTLLFQQVTVV